MIRTIIWSVLYWIAAAPVLLGLSIELGDCGFGGRDRQQCIESDSLAFRTAILLAIALYGFLLWRRNRSRQLP